MKLGEIENRLESIENKLGGIENIAESISRIEHNTRPQLKREKTKASVLIKLEILT